MVGGRRLWGNRNIVCLMCRRTIQPCLGLPRQMVRKFRDSIGMKYRSRFGCKPLLYRKEGEGEREGGGRIYQQQRSLALIQNFSVRKFARGSDSYRRVPRPSIFHISSPLNPCHRKSFPSTTARPGKWVKDDVAGIIFRETSRAFLRSRSLDYKLGELG